MSGKYGSVVMCSAAVAVAQVVNVVSKVLNKGGLLSLFGLLEPINTLKGIDLSKFKDELGELGEDDRKAVQKAFTDTLDLADKAVQAKIVGTVGYLEKAIDLVNRALGMVNEGKSLVLEVKAFLGL